MTGTVVALSTIMSSLGDATGQIGYGGTAPTGTDYTSALQAAINSVGSNTLGGMLIWDGAWGHTGLTIPSNVWIFCPSPLCGAILRNGSNKRMFANSGSMGNDVSSNKQNTFGKINPTPGGDQKYRILDASFFANQNIRVSGGTWNGNRANQSGVFNGTTGGFYLFQFYGVNGLIVEGITGITCVGFMVVAANVQDYIARDNTLDQSPTPGYGTDTLHVNGPATRLRFYNNKTHCGDDNIALNADDANDTLGKAANGPSFACGTNYPCSGAITDVLIDGLTVFPGAENGTSVGGIRLLSAAARIDDVTIRKVSGVTTGQCFVMTNYQGQTLVTGNGNLGRVNYQDINIAFSAPTGGADQIACFNFDIQGDLIDIVRRKIVNPPNVEDVWFGNNSGGGMGIVRYDVECVTNSSGTNYAQPIILVGGSVLELIVTANAYRDFAMPAAATPIVKTLNSAANILNLLDITVTLDRATNVVDHQAGTINTVRMRGLHSNASSGSPLNIASGCTIKNGIYPDLAFVGSFKSGSGVLTNDSASSYVAGNHYAN